MFRTLIAYRVATRFHDGPRAARTFSTSKPTPSGINQALDELRDISVSPENDLLTYNKAVKIYNPAYSKEHPAFVALPQNIHDIQRCLKVASSNAVPVAVKSGGHCFAGYSSICSNGFMISMNNLKEVEVDEGKGLVTVQSGACWGDVYRAADITDYMAVGGCVPDVGVGGYILGGGYSLMSRNYGGLACDSAISFTMVTADGTRKVTASEKNNQDLFWALRGGGGGNFGILVDVTLKLYRRPKEFKWARLTYDTTEGIQKGMEAIGRSLNVLPKELNLDMAVHLFNGKKQLTLDAVYSSHNQEKVEEALLRLHPLPFNHAISYKCYSHLLNEYSVKHGFHHYEKKPVYIKGSMIRSIPSSLAEYFSEVDIPNGFVCLIEFVHMGGDIQNLAPKDTAFPWRSSQYNVFTYGSFDIKNNAQREQVFKFATSVNEVVEQCGCSTGSYVNYMDRYLDNWANKYYGDNYERLCAVKEKWNPLGQGALHFQQEIGSSWNPEDSRKMTQNIIECN